MLKISVFGTSHKKNEKRIPIHPSLFQYIPTHVRKHLIFEEGYASSLGIQDSFLCKNFGGVISREELFSAEMSGYYQNLINQTLPSSKRKNIMGLASLCPGI